jgi:hypothetical protein
MTSSEGYRDNAVIMSSATPSEKYCPVVASHHRPLAGEMDPRTKATAASAVARQRRRPPRPLNARWLSIDCMPFELSTLQGGCGATLPRRCRMTLKVLERSATCTRSR